MNTMQSYVDHILIIVWRSPSSQWNYAFKIWCHRWSLNSFCLNHVVIKPVSSLITKSSIDKWYRYNMAISYSTQMLRITNVPIQMISHDVIHLLMSFIISVLYIVPAAFVTYDIIKRDDIYLIYCNSALCHILHGSIKTATNAIP